VWFLQNIPYRCTRLILTARFVFVIFVLRRDVLVAPTQRNLLFHKLYSFSKRIFPKMFAKSGLSLNKTATRAVKLNLTHSSPFSSAVNYQNFWMPFTDNLNFKKKPRKIFHRAEGVYYYLEDGTPILDGMSGLWCVNAGHGQPKIVKAIQDQAAKMDFAPSFNTSHELPYKFSEKVLELLPGKNFTDVFFTMCGSTAVDTALKMALQYHRSRGEPSKVRFIGRERAYHGVGFGGSCILFYVVFREVIFSILSL
jgi:beta-alanine--pyruvate transaminase